MAHLAPACLPPPSFLLLSFLLLVLSEALQRPAPHQRQPPRQHRLEPLQQPPVLGLTPHPPHLNQQPRAQTADGGGRGPAPSCRSVSEG